MALTFVETKGVKDANIRRKDIELILENEGFTFKTNKVDSTKKVWLHPKISYLYIFTNNTSYYIRCWSMESKHYELRQKQYSNERTLVDILTDE